MRDRECPAHCIPFPCAAGEGGRQAGWGRSWREAHAGIRDSGLVVRERNSAISSVVPANAGTQCLGSNNTQTDVILSGQRHLHTPFPCAAGEGGRQAGWGALLARGLEPGFAIRDSGSADSQYFVRRPGERRDPAPRLDRTQTDMRHPSRARVQQAAFRHPDLSHARCTIRTARLVARTVEDVVMPPGESRSARTAVVLAAAGIAMLAAGYLAGKFLVGVL